MSIASLSAKVRLAWWVRPSLRVLNILAPAIAKSPRLTNAILRSVPFIARHGVKVAA